MAQTFLVFNFGSDEDAAQQARLTIDRWKQGFRLDKKLLLKFDRQEKEKEKEKGGKKDSKDSGITLIVRLDFSDHEKLSHQRWADRIPSESPFKEASPQVIHSRDAEFAKTAERFEQLS